MSKRIDELNQLDVADVTDDDLIIVWDSGAGSDNTKYATRADFLTGVISTGDDPTFGDITADDIGAATGSIDALETSTGITVGGGDQITGAAYNDMTFTVSTLAADASEDHAKTFTGIVSGDCLSLTFDAALPAGLVAQAYVSAADQVTVRFSNASGSSITGASYNARCMGISFA